MKSLNSIKAIVTGGASGLGLATASTIIENGGKVVILDNNQEKGTQAQKLLGNNFLFILTDVTQENDIDSAVSQASEFLGQINLAVNCAGISLSQRVLGIDGLMKTSTFEQIIKINLVSTFSLIRAVANLMQNNDAVDDGERSVIINTASIAAFDGQVGQAAYSASKGGIVSMTLPLAREFSRFGIRVVTIAPGVFKTPLFDSLPEKAVHTLEEATPFPRRFGNPDEFASLVLHIFQNVMINGEIIRLDGALRMN